MVLLVVSPACPLSFTQLMCIDITCDKWNIQLQLRASVNITNGDLTSEAFEDPRAALLFQVDDDVPGRAYFALPVVIPTATDLVSDIGCADAMGFRGTLIWRLDFGDIARTSGLEMVLVKPLVAIPAWYASAPMIQKRFWCPLAGRASCFMRIPL